MKLDEVVRLLGSRVQATPRFRHDAASPEVTGLTYDSRRVGSGTLFVCIKGARFDGHDFADEARQRGVAAIVCARSLDTDAPQIVVDDSRAAMNLLAAPIYGHPSRRLEMAGITGTKGKTTTAFMLHSILTAAGISAGLIGTIEVRFNGHRAPGVRTTPQSADLQRLLREMVDAAVTRCVMEATSIGIHQGRVEGTEFDVAIFTNLSRDHLDEYHETMDAYYEAKKLLFVAGRVEQALINIDDSWGRRLAGEVDVKKLTYGLDRPADLIALDVEAHGHGSRFSAVGAGMELVLEPRLPGRVNVSNALAAAGAAHLLGVNHDAIAQGIASLTKIPGRFERIDEGQEFVVLVDYAHTPDSLREALSASRGLTDGGRLIVVFGCGGDRDRAKRPLMGEAAARGADLALVTSDNPRSEDPHAILREIEAGLAADPPSGGYRLIPERAEAIDAAIHEARPGDVVIIAGKGHETGQELAGRIIPFDDREVAREVLRRLG